MKLLLCKSIEKLGIVGDIVEVRTGYARNYLLPHGLATTPTKGNMRALSKARLIAEDERLQQRKQLESLAERLGSVEVTIRAKANEDGVLYGSVGTKEIADALREEGQPVQDSMIVLDAPLRHLDNVNVKVKLTDDLISEVKVWVVREKSESDTEPDEGKEAGTGADDHRINE